MVAGAGRLSSQTRKRGVVGQFAILRVLIHGTSFVECHGQTFIVVALCVNKKERGFSRKYSGTFPVLFPLDG